MNSNKTDQFNLYIFLIIGLFLLTLATLTGCGGASGLPQTSLPLPENGPLTVTSPNAQGLVLITGAASAVPDGAKLIVSVNTPNVASLDIEHLLNKLVSPAMAQGLVCTSELPVCPTLDGGSCQADANVDGSFQFEVPAEIDDEISVSYLDSDNQCLEVKAYLLKVISGILSMSLEGISLAYDSLQNQILIFGMTPDGATIEVRNASDGSLITTLIPSVTGIPKDLTVIEDTFGAQYLVMQTDTGTYLAPYSGNVIDSANQKLFVADEFDTILSDLKFLFVDHFEVPFLNDNGCVNPDFGFEDQALHTRLFLTDGQNIYVLDSLNNLDLDLRSFSDNLVLRQINLNLLDFPDDDVVTIPLVAQLESTYVAVLGLSNSTTQLITYIAVELARDSGYCSNILELGADTKTLVFGGTEGEVFVTQFGAHDSDINPIVKLALLQRDAQIISVIDATNMQLAETILLESVISSYEDLAIDSVDKFLGFTRPGSDVFELFLIGDLNAQGGFISSDISETTLGQGTLVNAIKAGSMRANIDLSKIFILDVGLSADDQSNLIILDIL